MNYLTETERFTLIKGEFEREEARDILLGMINYKINFHELRNFGATIQNGQEDDLSVTRINELQETRDQILAMFNQMEPKGKLKITSKIIIEFTH